MTFPRIITNRFRTGRGRVLGLALVLLVLAIGASMAALLLWWPAVAAAEPSTRDSSGWWQTSAPFAILARATPTPAPTPTLTSSQIAAQFVPELQTARSGRHWDRALEIVAIMRAVDPSGEQARQWAHETAMQYGQALVDGGQVDDAQHQFDEAVSLIPNGAEARLWQQTTTIYRAGRNAAAGGDWEAALESFTLVEERMPSYGDLSARLAQAYRGQGEAAIEAEDWTLAIEALTQLRKRMPADQAVLTLLSKAYGGQAQAAMTEGDWPAAVDTMLEAHERLPNDQNVKELLSRAYRGQGWAAMAQEDWSAAIEALSQGHEQLPGDQDILAALASAYRQRGISLQERGTRNTKSLHMNTLREARADLQDAVELQPDNVEAQTHLKQVENLLFPHKKIEVDISKQRLYAWEGDELVYEFPVSTGLRGQDTATGRFQILDKIPMAYSRIWELSMPNWMGVYYVKGIENGFHGLPYRPDGSKMWAGLLGRRASYGCIVLGTKPAKTLYAWAEIGTRVDIHN